MTGYELLIPIRIKYAAKIRSGLSQQNWVAFAQGMADLLSEWNPLNQPIDHLIFLAGPPSRTDEGSVSYEFENGIFGRGWKFTIENGVIISIAEFAIE